MINSSCLFQNMQEKHSGTLRSDGTQCPRCWRSASTTMPAPSQGWIRSINHQSIYISRSGEDLEEAWRTRSWRSWATTGRGSPSKGGHWRRQQGKYISLTSQWLVMLIWAFLQGSLWLVDGRQVWVWECSRPPWGGSDGGGGEAEEEGRWTAPTWECFLGDYHRHFLVLVARHQWHHNHPHHCQGGLHRRFPSSTYCLVNKWYSSLASSNLIESDV